MCLADSLSSLCNVDGVSTKPGASEQCVVACNKQEMLSHVHKQKLLKSSSNYLVSRKCMGSIWKGWQDKIKSNGEIVKLINVQNRLTF